VRILVTGAGGMVGGALATALSARGHDVAGTIRDAPAPPGLPSHTVRLEERREVESLLDEVAPDVMVHAAYARADLRRDVVDVTDCVAGAVARRGVGLVALSTDAVFDGDHPPYAEDDEPFPVHDYGAAKRTAERVVLDVGGAVVRSALIAHLDASAPDPASRWLIEANRRGERVTLFTDEIRSVIRLVDLVAALVRLVELPAGQRGGCWHLGGPVPLSRDELGAVIADHFGLDTSLIGRATSPSTPTPRRPKDVTVTCRRAVDVLSFAPEPVGTVSTHGPTS
jgi:dTDP-4-dehydrorhamnose reductase